MLVFGFIPKKQADSLNVYGDVRNQNDGSVSMHVTGERDNVLAFVKCCHSGPTSADVKELEYSETDSFDAAAFEIVRI